MAGNTGNTQRICRMQAEMKCHQIDDNTGNDNMHKLTRTNNSKLVMTTELDDSSECKLKTDFKINQMSTH